MSTPPVSVLKLSGALGPEVVACVLGWKYSYTHQDGTISFLVPDDDVTPYSYDRLKETLNHAGLKLHSVESKALISRKIKNQHRYAKSKFILWAVAK